MGKMIETTREFNMAIEEINEEINIENYALPPEYPLG